MSWNAIEIRAGAVEPRRVCVGIGNAKGRLTLYVRIGPGAAEELGFKENEKLRIAWGDGAERGKMRIDKSDENGLKAVRKNSTSLSIRSAVVPPPMVREKKLSTPCEWAIEDGAAIITLDPVLLVKVAPATGKTAEVPSPAPSGDPAQALAAAGAGFKDVKLKRGGN